jgi:plastocyanin domain-containing protein
VTTKKTYLLAAIASLALFGSACADKKKDQPTPAAPVAAAAKRFDVTVTEKGFEPDKLTVPAAQPVTLVFTRKTDQTCVKKVVVDLGDGKKEERELPLDKPVEIAATFPKVGQLRYACGMDMMSGTLTVQ